MMRRQRFAQVAAVLLALLGAFLVLVSLPDTAHGAVTRLESPDTQVRAQHVTYVELVGTRVLYVELNDGSTYKFTPCKVEDSANCYWSSRGRGNHIGHSFIALGHRSQVRVMYLEPAYARTHDHTVTR